MHRTLSARLVEGPWHSRKQDLIPRHHRQLCMYRHTKAHQTITCGLVGLQGLLACPGADARVPCKAHGCACGMHNWDFLLSAEPGLFF